jgi:hypothetical protein
MWGEVPGFAEGAVGRVFVSALPQKRTFAVQSEMSAMGYKRT